MDAHPRQEQSLRRLRDLLGSMRRWPPRGEADTQGLARSRGDGIDWDTIRLCVPWWMLTYLQEELDLNALSVEAHRALAQTPNVVNPQNPDVTILVQNPIIAIKYPMTNGQVMESEHPAFFAYWLLDTTLSDSLIVQRRLP